MKRTIRRAMQRLRRRSTRETTRNRTALAFEPLEDRRLLATLNNGPGGGTVSVTVDEYGAFGAQVGGAAGDAFLDPIGVNVALGTTFESGVALGFGGGRTFLTTGDIQGSGGLPGLATFDTPLTSWSTVVISDVEINLFQSLGLVSDGGVPIGSLLTQTYYFRNVGAATTTFDFIRYLDSELEFPPEESLLDGGGRVVNNGTEFLYISDNIATPADVEELLAITLGGGTPIATNRFEMDDFPVLAGRIIAGNPLRNTIDGDPDNDAIIEAVYEVSAALRTTYAIDPEQLDRATTTTFFGTIRADRLVIPNPGSISGFKFEDLTRDGERQPGEPPVPGFEIYLDLNRNGVLDPGEPTTTTGTDGAYVFTDVFPGTYAVAEVPQDGWEMISPATGTQDLTVGFGENVIGVNFANVRPRIGGIKYHDLNGNGTQQAGEPNLEGWTVFIDANDNGLLDPLEPTSVTDQFGRYEFVGLATGTYIIREIQQSSWIQTAPSEGFYVVDYEADSVAVGRDFGNQRLGGLRGVKFHDVNENGLRDANEPGLGGWTIFLDLNNNGLRDGNEPFDVTNSNGSYVITDVAPITYTVAEVPQTNWEQTFPGGDGTQTVNLFGGITAANINFGNKGFASIEGVKFNDLDADGVRDPGEPGLPNFYIYLDANNNNHPGVGERGAFTDEDGNYKIARVEPGNYQLREVVSTRWRQTAPASGEYTANLRAGDELKGFDFGNVGLVDWGDAPIIYPVRSFEAGANHGIVAGFHLGPGAATVTKVDGDPNGQPSATAIGDDTNGLDDEDGVFGLDTPLVASTTKEITVIGSAAQDTLKGKLQGWVDFNWDGDWDDPGEQIVTDLIIARGPNTITFAVPADAKGGPTFARFRISYEFGLSPRGPTAAGEVEDYLVNINSTTTPFGTGATPLGTITDNTFDSLSITSPGELFSMTASQTGIFTAIAGFANREGNIDMAVFDAAGNPLGDSSSTRNQERIDFDSTAGETYYLRLYGENSGDVDLELFNLLAMNSPLTIMGTPGDDVVTVNAPDSSLGTTCSDCVEVTVNGTPYLFDARVKVTYEGNGGFDRLIVNSNDYNDQIRFYADATEVLNPTFQFDTMGVEDVRIDGGGGADRAWYHDMPGDETLRITQEFALRTQGSYRQQATNVSTVIGYSNDTDKDTALIYDSPGNDNLIARPDSVRLEGNGFFFYVVDYRNVLTYATAGGTNDKAYIYDGAGDEQLIVNPDLARMFGDDFYNYIRGFDRIYAYATGGGSNDTASLHGSSGDDTLVARPNSVVMSGSGFYYYTRNFERVYSYAKAGENDRAYMFDSSGNDVLMSRPAYTVLSGTTFYNYANGFDRVYAYATAGGTADYAYFYDSIGNDRFVARPDIARMEGSGFYNVASSFDKVQAYATAGGTDDRADVYDGSGNDLLFGRDDYFYFMGGNFDNRGVGFDSVYGYSVGGGLNTLDVLDNLYAFTPLGTWL